MICNRVELRVAVYTLIATSILLLIVFARAPYRKTPQSLFVSDGFGYYIYLPSIVLDRDLELSNQLAQQDEQPDQQWYAWVRATQRPGNCFQVGCAVLWSPFFFLAHGGVLLARTAGAEVSANGFGFAYELPVYIGSFAYGMLGVWYIWRLLRELFDDVIAEVVAFYVATATALAAYLWFEPDMSHVVSMTLISALFYYLYRIHQEHSLQWRRWAVIGLLLGMIAAVRATDSFVTIAAFLVGIHAITVQPAKWKNALISMVACTVCAILAFLPQMIAWKFLYGGYLTRPPGVYNEIFWTHPDLLGFFVGAKRGIFIWTPLLAFSMVGVLIGFVRGPSFLRYAFLVLLIAIYFNASIPNWWVGASFSERRTVDYTVLFALGLGVLLNLRPAWANRFALHAVGLSLCAFNWILMLRYFTHQLPEYGHVSWYDLYVGTLTFPVHAVQRLIY